MMGTIDMVSIDELREVVVVRRRAVGTLIVAGSDGSPEAVEASEQIQDEMAEHLGRVPMNVFIDVSSKTVREYRAIDIDPAIDSA